MIQNKPKVDQPSNKAAKTLKSYARYAGIGFQMIAVIGLFTFIGYKLDEQREAELPLLTALFSLAGVCIALYQVIRTVIKK